MHQYSIIIPTHNRQNLIPKNIEYFSQFQDCLIYICDSSTEEYRFSFPTNIQYCHMPQKSFVEKMHMILAEIKTPYVSVCADDDYIMEDTVVKMIHAMGKDNYVMAIGEYAGFNIPFQGFYSIYTQKPPRLDGNDPLDRVRKYLGHYYMSLWAVYSSDTLKKAYSILNDATYTNQNFIEMVIATTSAAEGKILFVNELYGVREINNQMSKNWAKGHLPLFSEYVRNNKTFQLQINAIDDSFSQHSIPGIFKKGVRAYIYKSFFEYALQKIQKLFPSQEKYSPIPNDTSLEIIANLICKYQNQ